ncbi:hypothetical protein Dimus_019611 [Dionaea muscipula]
MSESIRESQSRVSVDLEGLEQEKLGDLPCVDEGLDKLKTDLPLKMTVEEVDALQTERNALSSGRGRPYLKALKVTKGNTATGRGVGRLEWRPKHKEGSKAIGEVCRQKDEAVSDAKGLKAIMEPVTGSQTHEDPSEALKLQGGTGQGA